MNELERCEYLKNIVSYDKDSGILTWLQREGNSHGDKVFNGKFAGKEITTPQGRGYIVINFTVDGIKYKQVSHRFAWFCVNDKLPDGVLDHIDGDGSNNRIENLRDVTQSINMRNASRRKNNTSGITGVYFSKQRNKWIAQAVGYGSRHIGAYLTKEEAQEAVLEYRLQLGYTENHGRDNCK